MAEWIYIARLFSGSINKFFKDRRLRPFYRYYSFDSALLLKAKLFNIKYSNTDRD